MKYININSKTMLPDLSHLKPYRCVVVIEDELSKDRQELISRWLVETGCLYMMAWGKGCSSWDDSVDMANLEQFDFGEVPESEFVMTTWHENAPLLKAFEHCKYAAHHSVHELENVVVLHLALQARANRFEAEYKNT